MNNGTQSPCDPEQEGPKERREAGGRKWVLTVHWGPGWDRERRELRY